MSQNRPPPAYQEYAASMLANIAFRKMSLSARGLLYTLRLETWVETPLPSNSYELSQLLRFEYQEVDQALKEIFPFLNMNHDELRIPELDCYRQHLIERRDKQSAGGREGARRAKENKSKTQKDDSVGADQDTQGSTTGYLVKKNSTQLSSDQNSPVSNVEDDPWVHDYNNAEEA